MVLASKHLGQDLPLIVIGGDTLFYDDFSLASAISEHSSHNSAHNNTASLVLTHLIDDAGTLKSGILELDASSRVCRESSRLKPIVARGSYYVTPTSVVQP
jgi:hypothetical protein